ncbi:EFR1 family ferrodoxin [Acetobacterium bakii]|uniref:4Fe-4S ferredoxin-type domain-containing protein n=1 Tax=Acetobacterium bakii TaxID=52689 RepID=A0A0L6TZ51_9FIRM|nr:EFR1 family ferrodoxin [Acetobacterium bakii]KNZ41556.1 hypothetical protein AKG39_11240 [Acetobacterium bakii]
MDYKKVNLVYFSGTGGTAKVVDAFEKAFLNHSIDIERTELNRKYEPASLGDLLVVLFPVYAFNAPTPIDEWIKEVPMGQGRPAAVISVSGGGEISPNTACRVGTIRRLKRKGYHVVYEKMFVMPSNFLVKYDDSLCAMMLRAAPEVAEKAVTELLEGVQRRTIPYGIDRLASMLGFWEKKGSKIFGKHLSVKDNCIGCSWCETHCPRENIRLYNSRPVFGNDCVLCLRCVYGCPQQAIIPGIGKFMVVNGGFNISKIEIRMKHVTVFPRIEDVAKGPMLKGVRDYLMESSNNAESTQEKSLLETHTKI